MYVNASRLEFELYVFVHVGFQLRRIAISVRSFDEYRTIIKSATSFTECTSQEYTAYKIRKNFLDHLYIIFHYARDYSELLK